MRARRVALEARAKLNLGLAVGPRRADGFHELATVFQSVSLSDTLVAERAARGFALRVVHEDASIGGGGRRVRGRGVPLGASNLVLRAARLVSRRLGLPGGARFRLVKRIPAGAGLGGGSADAAAALVAVARLHGVRLALADRLALAGELGSDVPFAVLGGTALGLGRGERLHPLKLAGPFRAVIAVPRWKVPTGKAFGQIRRNKYALTVWRAKLRFAQSLERKRLDPRVALRLGNSFERVLGSRRSDFDSLSMRLRAAGVEEVRLTGSGSAVFAVLAPGVPFGTVATRFEGGERLYAVRTVGSGIRPKSAAIA